MCMMCEEDAIYSAYLDWKAQKDQEEAARQAAARTDAPEAPPRAQPASGPDAPKPSFTCD
jgi:hypothetical protein